MPRNDLSDLPLEPWRKQHPSIQREIDLRVAAARTERTIEASKKLDAVLEAGIKEGRRMSLLGKMKALTESAEDFTKETGDVLDGIATKIATARTKRDAAAEKHHLYYDGIIQGVDDSVTVIDRLSNLPLGDDGKS